MRTRLNILFCLLTALWLVMQVVVPAYHHHAAGGSNSSAGLQWQNAQDDQHECYICHLNHSPANVTLSHSELVPALEPVLLTVPAPSLYPSDLIAIPPVRAPPAV